MNFSIYDLKIINRVNNRQLKFKINKNSTQFDHTWEDLCIQFQKGITIGFINPEKNNSFDIESEYDYLYSLGLDSFYNIDSYTRIINSLITKSNPIPGNINSFTLYAIIDGVIKEFNISRTVSIYKKEDSLNIEYIVNPITIESNWKNYKIVNGNYKDKIPSILTINLS